MPAYKERTLARVESMLEELREKSATELTPQIKKALEEWSELVISEARRLLARPHWLLSGALGRKVKEYKASSKVFALVGFRFRENNKRDPGYYGRFHEGGWAPRGKKVTAPSKFIKRGKQKYLPLLQERIDELARELLK